MAHFLRLTGFRENVEEIDQAARYIEHLWSLSPEGRKSLTRRLSKPGRRVTFKSELRRALSTILREAADLKSVVGRFRSDPFVYTGSGSTDDVLQRLERAVGSPRPRVERPDRPADAGTSLPSGSPAQLELAFDQPPAASRGQSPPAV